MMKGTSGRDVKTLAEKSAMAAVVYAMDQAGKAGK
jgi:hypothetical protein